MKEADLFRRYAKEAMRAASSKSTNADERRALINLACRYSQAALMSERIVLGSSFVPSPRRPALKEPTLSFDLFMDDTCPTCRTPLRLAVVEQHASRRDLAVDKFDCEDGGRVKTKILFRKQAVVADRLDCECLNSTEAVR